MDNITASLVPMVVKSEKNGERSYDIYSRLLSDRIIFLNEEINSQSAGIVVAQLLHLASIDDKSDIQLYVNTPGGEVISGLAIVDTMNLIKPDVSTICVGMAASMGSVILSSGARGKRFCLPHSTVMIHQPSGGAHGQQTEIEIAAQQIKKTRETLNKMLAENCGKSYRQIEKDTERDTWLTAQEAIEYGLADSVITSA